MNRTAIAALPALLLLAAPLPVSAELKASTKPYRGSTTAQPSEYSVTYGGRSSKPRNYDLYYNQERYGRRPVAVTATRPATPPRPIRIGAVSAYSNVEYGQMIIKAIEESKAMEAPPIEVAEEAPAPALAVPDTGALLSRDIITSVSSEGILATASGAELRLRGVSFPSVDSPNEVERRAGLAAMDAVQSSLTGQTIFYTVEKPAADHLGRTMIIAHLEDGTEVNRMVVESGMARVNPYDFANVADSSKLVTAEADAARDKRGLWGE